MKAFSPAGITSFFLIKDTFENGRPIKESKKIGACGGGFIISHGVTTEIRIESAPKTSIQVYINGREVDNARTTIRVVERILNLADKKLKIDIRHKVEVPIGAGYGSSGAGALSTAIVLARMLELNLTLNQTALIAHISEVECGTGLGTVAPLTMGGPILTLQSGGPGIAVIDRLIADSDLKILSVYFNSIYTKKILSSPEVKSRVNKEGLKTLVAVKKTPNIESFMRHSKVFAQRIGLMTKRVEELIYALEGSGAVGATQNMIGEAVHAVFEPEDIKRGVKTTSELKDSCFILVSDLNFEGVKLL